MVGIGINFKRHPKPTAAEIFKGSIFVRKGQEDDMTLVLTHELDLGNLEVPHYLSCASERVVCLPSLLPEAPPRIYSLEIKMGC